MPALTKEQIDERLNLYSAYRDALTKVEEVAAEMPEEFPSDFVLACESMNYGALNRAMFVVKRAWPSLRKAVLADAEKELALAEEAVVHFERGEEV